MTREEAYNRIDAIIAMHEIDDNYVTITSMLDYDALRMARKTLEQEPILDKIKAEIEEELSKDNHSWYKAGMEFCLKIINKHTESE